MIKKKEEEDASANAPRGVNETKRIFKELRRLRKENPDVTIILPTEKTVVAAADVQARVTPWVMVMKNELDNGYVHWNGRMADSHIKQVKKMLSFHFNFELIPEKRLDEVLDGLLYVT